MSGAATPTPNARAGAGLSILWPTPPSGAEQEAASPPSCFADLNLDQVVSSITSAYGDYRLEPLFHLPLPDLDAVGYRHQVFRDLEDPANLELLRSFAADMREVRRRLEQARQLHHPLQQRRWRLDAAATYCAALPRLLVGLEQPAVRAAALQALRDFLQTYVPGAAFQRLTRETGELQAELAAIRYTLHIQGNRITVGRAEGEEDYSTQVEATFAKFSEQEAGDYRVSFPKWPEMNHIEGAILDRVARLFPDTFQALDRYHDQHRDFIDPTLERCDREAHFYLAYLEHQGRLAATGLPFCYPELTLAPAGLEVREGFDICLAEKLLEEGAAVVSNDFELQGPQRILVVTGPNQGGKTTFARAFGQLHYLAALGCPVPARRARLALFDGLFTLFAREESADAELGKLEQELLQVQAILRAASARSVLVMNEVFTSTTLSDARFLGRRVLDRVSELGLVAVYVTFVDELAALGEAVVSLVSRVDPEHPSQRTYKLEARPADGRAYAEAVADQHGLTYRRLKERLGG